MFAPVETADGSNTFYSQTYGEWFHSRQGACYEAQETYIKSVRLAQRVRSLPAGQPLRVLDVCYGLGYNTAVALETIWQVNPECQVDIKALEIDLGAARSAIAQDLIRSYSLPVQDTLGAIAAQLTAQTKAARIQLLLGDARQQIQPLVAQGWQADIIFLDPFSPPHCPQLWTIEFLSLVSKCLKREGGELATYSCAAAVRSALMEIGLSIKPIQTPVRKWPGTLASYSLESTLDTTLSLFSQQEREHLQTRAAVPYRDPSLQASAKEILTRREKEQRASSLLSASQWRSRWKQKAF